MSIRRKIAIAALIGGIALAARLPGIGNFMTVDEQNWMIRSAEFYHKLFRNSDPGGTFLTTHPGTTGMWLIGAGEVIQEKRLGIDVDESTVKEFRLAATLPVAIATSLLIGTAVFFLLGLWGVFPALGAGGLLALDPYLTGMSQIAHLDALLALFMLNALLAFLLSQKLQTTPPAGGLKLQAGIFTGLALATKLLPALWLFVIFGLIMLPALMRNWRNGWQQVIRTLGIISAVAALTLFAAWPALWVKTDLSNSIVRDTASVVTDEHTAIEASEEPIHPASFYIRSVIGRSTPFILIVAIGMGIAEGISAIRKRTISPQLWLIISGIGYLLLITFVAKKADRYALPALVSFIAISGIGVASALRLVAARWKRLKFSYLTALISVLYVLQLFIWMPYPIAYNNPFFPNIRPRPQQGWGEGLDAAAQWLNQSPFIDRLSIASWYPSVTSTYFNGRTFSLSSREDHRVGYVVIYRNMEGRAEDDIASNVLDEFQDREPVHTISIGGTPYVWIYNVLGPYYFRQNTGELTSGEEVGQTLTVPTDSWDSLDIAFATYGRENTSTVRLEIRENKDGEIIRTATIPAADLPDQEWARLFFDPITDAKDKTYYISLTSDAAPGNAVTVRYTDEDVAPGEAFIKGRFREGDIGYRF